MTKNDYEIIEQLEVDGIGIARAGLKVSHDRFGCGEIEEIYCYKSGEYSIRVNFESHGSKALVPEYANLKLFTKPQKQSILGKLKKFFR